jgi:hypothetical protein
VKTIGLIGGMSWESSIEYYRIINETVKERLGGLHSAKCIMHSVDFAEVEPLQHEGRWEEAAEHMVRAAQSVEAAGADFLVLCTNTMHKTADENRHSRSVPHPGKRILVPDAWASRRVHAFCAVALSNLSNDPEPSLWRLARNVNGWGRIHVVERLAQTENPEIKNWLLREGYRNSVMYEYLAYTCAVAGGLLSALSEDTVDRELLTSTGEILAALIAGGPAENIDDYEDGALAVEMFLASIAAEAD